MAFVVARPKGRFEIRESVHTQKGPRARSLANFSVLTDAVLAVAAERATRTFDATSVRRAAGRVGAPIAPGFDPTPRTDMQRFVESSRRMAASMEPQPGSSRGDPGQALIELLHFADQVRAAQPARPAEPLRFPPMARLAAQHGAVSESNGK